MTTLPMTSMEVERDNRAWLADLKAEGQRSDDAQTELRRWLVRRLAKTLSSRGVSAAEVEDFVQEAMVKILDNLDDFRGDSRLTTWAMAIAIRTAFSELRRARYEDRSLDQMVAEANASISSQLTVDADAESSIQRQQILAVMHGVIEEELGAKQRTVLLGELAGVPKSVLAERLDSNTNAVYKLGHDARRRLRDGMLATGLSESDIRALWTS